MALKYFRQLYSLDTLDTRFVIPATAPPRDLLEEARLDPDGPIPQHGGNLKSKAGDFTPPRRWNTLEFYLYGISVTLSILYMFKSNLEVSQGTCR